MTLARYVFIFHLKNPARFQDDFWHLFLNIWIVGFGLVSQFVFVYLPGQQPINFYICAGLDPRTASAGLEDAAPKRNHIFIILLVSSMALQLAIAVKFIVHRMKMDSASTYAYVESFNGRLRDECLNEHWFTSLDHAKRVIETWRCEYNEERPKRSLGGLTPAQYAKQLAIKAVTMPEDSKAPCY